MGRRLAVLVVAVGLLSAWPVAGWAEVESDPACSGADDWWTGTYQRVESVGYARMSLLSITEQWRGGQGIPSVPLIRSFADVFARAWHGQYQSPVPAAARDLNRLLIQVFADWTLIATRTGDGVEGIAAFEDPQPVLGAIFDADDLGTRQIPPAEQSFIARCHPINRNPPGQGGEDYGLPQSTATLDCGDFPTQADAQRWYELLGGPRRDQWHLDADGDGQACETLT